MDSYPKKLVGKVLIDTVIYHVGSAAFSVGVNPVTIHVDMDCAIESGVRWSRPLTDSRCLTSSNMITASAVRSTSRRSIRAGLSFWSSAAYRDACSRSAADRGY